jgi:hypothetical protein
MKCFLFMLLFVTANLAQAKEFPISTRFFASSLTVDPKDLNEELTAQSLIKLESVSLLGLEINHKTYHYLEFGFRYTKRLAKNEESPASSSTDFFSDLDQDTILLLARVPFFKSQFFRADVFAGVGGSNTRFKIKTASQDGQLLKAESNDWYASPYASAGGSVGFGYKNFFLVLEGGIESNQVKDFKRKGNINSNVDEIDLSGSYFSVSILIDGLTGFKK